MINDVFASHAPMVLGGFLGTAGIMVSASGALERSHSNILKHLTSKMLAQCSKAVLLKRPNSVNYLKTSI